MEPTINPDGTLTIGTTILNTEQVEQLTRKLLLARARMEPSVPLRFPQDRDPHVQDQPHMEISRNSEGITLAIRHTGAGWFVFTLPERQAHFLVAGITKRIGRPPVDLPDLESAQGKPN